MAELKTVNKGAVEYFKTRGQRYLALREELKEMQLEAEDLGDIETDDLQKFASLAETRAKKGIEFLERWQKGWEETAANLKIMHESAETPEDQKAKLLRRYYSANISLNLINLFKNIIVTLTNSKTNARKAAEAINNDEPLILNAIKADDYRGIRTSIASLRKDVTEFAISVGDYESASEAYRQSIQKSPEKLNINPISRAKAEELITALVTAIYKYQAEKVENPTKAPELERTIISLEDGIRSIEIVIGSRLTKQLRTNVERKLAEDKAKQEKAEKDNRLIEFKGQLSAAINALYNAIIKKYNTPNWPPAGEQRAMANAHSIAFDKFQDIDMSTRNTLFHQMFNEMEARLNKHYGKELYTALKDVEIILDDIAALNVNSRRPDEELKGRYERLVDRIQEFSKNNASLGIKAVVERENLSVSFNNPEITDIKATILNKEIIDRLYPLAKDPEPIKVDPEPKKTDPEPTKVDPEPTKVDPIPASTTEQDDINYYLEMLKATNAQVIEINKINTQLLLHSKLSELSMAAIDADIEYEDIATYQSALLTRKLLDLSETRYNFLKKHGKYIVSNEQVKNTPIQEVRFNAEFEQFVRSRDELIVDTELRILELDRTKPVDYEKQIESLRKFIMAQNSLVNRFLVAESVTRNIDIAKFLEERNNRRKAIRLEKEKALANNPTVVNPVQEPVKEPVQNNPSNNPEQIVQDKPGQNDVPGNNNQGHQNPAEPPIGFVQEEIKEEINPSQEDKKENQNNNGAPSNDGPSNDEPNNDAPANDEPVQSRDIPHTKIDIRQTTLHFNPRNRRNVAKKITPNDVLFKNSPQITTTIIKNGVRIAMSKQLRERLAELNAKISLVNNKVKNSRTSRMVDANADYQDVTFKKDHDVNHQDYSVEIRIPGEKRSEVIFGEEIQHRSK